MSRVKLDKNQKSLLQYSDMHFSELGYQTYDGNEGYLGGHEWKQLHDFFYTFCGSYRCRVCHKKRGLVLHKRTYEVLSLRALRKKFFHIKPLMIRWLKRHFVWLCHEHNHQVHFYDDGTRVPLKYTALWKREQEVYRRHKSIWRKIRMLKPSMIFRFVGRLLTIYSV